MKTMKIANNEILVKPKALYPIKRKDRLKICTAEGIYIINKAEILYLNSQSNYCRLFMKNGVRVMCSSTLKYFEEKLPQHFLRVHQSYIVNTEHLSFVAGNYTAVHIHDHKIPVSRSQKDQLKAFIERYID